MLVVRSQTIFSFLLSSLALPFFAPLKSLLHLLLICLVRAHQFILLLNFGLFREPLIHAICIFKKLGDFCDAFHVADVLLGSLFSQMFFTELPFLFGFGKPDEVIFLILSFFPQTSFKGRFSLLYPAPLNWLVRKILEEIFHILVVQ